MGSQGAEGCLLLGKIYQCPVPGNHRDIKERVSQAWCVESQPMDILADLCKYT